MNVEDANSDEDGESNKEHGEEKILAQKRNSQGGRGNDLSQKQEEHSQGQQDGNAEGNLAGKYSYTT